MCEPKAAGRVPAAAVAVALGAVTLSAAAAFIESVALVILAVMGAAAAAGIAAFVVLVRRGSTLYAPQRRAINHTLIEPGALPAGQPRAVEARRQVIPGVVLGAGERIGS